MLAPDSLAACGYDIVLANILARPLIDLATRLTLLVARGGALVLAGMFEEQADAVRRAYAPAFDFAPAAIAAGWASLVGTRRREI